MARLGELLVDAKLLAPERVDQALRAQVVWGGRIGTNLVELGYIGLDELSRALGRQHNLPAALARHFDRSDPELQQRISAAFADRWSIVPLLRVGDDHKIAIACTDPLDSRGLATVADELALDPDRLVVSVAAELRIRYHLERIYKVPRGSRFLRSKGQNVTPFPELGEVDVPIESDPEIPITIEEDDAVSAPVRAPTSPEQTQQLAALIDEATDSAAPQPVDSEPTGRERRSYVRTLADLANVADAKETQPLGRIAIRRVVLGGTPGRGAPQTAAPPTVSSFDAATRAIRRGGNRERVAELVIDTIDRFAPGSETAMLLIIRGEVAIGWKWFDRSGATPPELAVPMDQPGLVPTVVERNAMGRCAADQLGPIDLLLLRALGNPDDDLVVIPVAVAGRVMCLIATAAEPDAPVEVVEAIAEAAGTAFARLIRNASR